MNQAHISAISVVHLATALKRHDAIVQSAIADISSELAEQVRILEQHGDLSGLFETRYPESWMIRLWTLATENTRNIDIGLQVGRALSPDTHGMLAHWMQHCDTLHDALTVYLEKTALFSSSENWQATWSDSDVKLILTYPNGRRHPACMIERNIVSVKTMGEYLSGGCISLQNVEFSFSRPPHAKQLEAFLDCPVQYGCNDNSILLSRSILDKPLPRRNHYLRELIQGRAEQLGLISDTRSVTEKVRGIITEHLPHASHIDFVTNRLHMSRTTLYRKLRNENTSFRNLLEQERRRIAENNVNLSASEMFERLGFRDISAYYKANKRWQRASRCR